MKKSLYITTLLTIFYSMISESSQKSHNSNSLPISTFLTRNTAVAWFIPLTNQRKQAESLVQESNDPKALQSMINKLDPLLTSAKRGTSNISTDPDFLALCNDEIIAVNNTITKLSEKIASLEQ